MARIAGCLLASFLSVLAAADAPAQEISFDRDIRPILSDKCSQCHGPDEAAREADLRLDLKENAFAERDGVAPFRAGDADASEAIRRIFSADPGERMPPPDIKQELLSELGGRGSGLVGALGICSSSARRSAHGPTPCLVPQRY